MGRQGTGQSTNLSEDDESSFREGNSQSKNVIEFTLEHFKFIDAKLKEMEPTERKLEATGTIKGTIFGIALFQGEI